MKKRYIGIFILLIVILSISLVNAGFLDGFFGNSNDSNSNFTDMGVSNNCSSDWYILTNITKTVTNNGTVLSSTGDSGVFANKPSTSVGWEDSFDWSTPFTVEFDVVDWDGTPSVRITDAKNDATKTFHALGIRNGSHVKIVSTDSSVTFNVDDRSLDPIEKSFDKAQIGFRLNDATITYKNFKIY